MQLRQQKRSSVCMNEHRKLFPQKTFKTSALFPIAVCRVPLTYLLNTVKFLIMNFQQNVWCYCSREYPEEMYKSVIWMWYHPMNTMVVQQTALSSKTSVMTGDDDMRYNALQLNYCVRVLETLIRHQATVYPGYWCVTRNCIFTSS